MPPPVPWILGSYLTLCLLLAQVADVQVVHLALHGGFPCLVLPVSILGLQLHRCQGRSSLGWV